MVTLQKSKDHLSNKMLQLETSMLSQNKNKSYLVSVEKAVKQSRNVAECGTQALHNICQIVKFFKIEKMHQLVFNTDRPTHLQAFEETSLHKLNQDMQDMEGYMMETEQNSPSLAKNHERHDNSADGDHEDSPQNYNVERV